MVFANHLIDQGGSAFNHIIRGNYYNKGKIPHEVSHTFGLSDNNYNSNGVLNDPSKSILPKEVNEILGFSYDKK